MRTKRAADWTPSATLPNTPVSFTGVTYAEMLDRARALVPAIAARAGDCEKLRRLPDDTELVVRAFQHLLDHLEA